LIASLSVRLRALRTGSGLTQIQVANAVGVTRAMISAYETDMRVPSFDVLVKLSVLYHVSTDYLLCDTQRQYIEVTGLSGEEIATVCKLISLLNGGKAK
jgi:transcriptional regulator with XRE-family HTH domain